MPDLSYLGHRVFKEPSVETGKLVETWNATSDINPEELGEYAEGDIRFPKVARNGMIAETLRWKDGIIPYKIDGFFDIDSLNSIKRAMDIYHKYTCIKFRKKNDDDDDYVSIVNSNTGCWSSVGRIGGKQEVNLQSPACTSRVGTPMHELMHAAGFLHEQNRFERDDFVDIAWSNIRKGHESNFDKADSSTTTGYGVPYDFRSVMHYSGTAFSTNGKPTIIPKDSSKTEKMGQREGFSKGDITKLNQMYKCPDKTASITGNSQSTNSGTESHEISQVENKDSSNPLVNLAQGIIQALFHK
ncbi:zinc metalloproteinase nas-13-like isoform X2 [Sitophilus oryzae]|nr:zinc metalloproteinase nas-13-like isoform X2 [Sitophilus oryzae]